MMMRLPPLSERVIAHLDSLPPGTRITTRELAEAVGTTTHTIHTVVPQLRALGVNLRAVRCYEVRR